MYIVNVIRRIEKQMLRLCVGEDIVTLGSTETNIGLV